MRALRFHRARELCVENVAEPGPPGSGEVLLRPVMCGICGTDLHEYTDGPIVTPASPHPLTGAELPQILGHEFSAVVAATGPGVTHVRAGDLCTVMPLISCGHCHECLLGRGHLCRTMACTGLSSAWGGLADVAIVSARQVVPVGEAITPRQAALIEPAAVAAYGIDRGRLQPGQTVLITGAGPIGSLATLYALAAGARRVVLSEPDPARRARAAALGDGLGEVITADPSAEPVAEIIGDLTGGTGADLAVECAGHESALNLCIDAVCPAGTVVQTALHIRPASIRAETLALKDLALIGTWCYPVQDFPRIAGLVASGRLPVERVISSVVPLESAVSEGFERLVTRGTGEVKVLIEVGA
ncbi:MAG: alcohol dehydrogenase catalytic domain-containing protein [Streptosporangiaceae bacterium]|nr:alcohol dehydrogenase catalytic domain-containing protein [Streptosporangiaceae bacterium]MBV9853789.1 alcohol dehydrogenase catalytic domain-containing protein [Streptosporangiaceae bacterium]